MKNRNNFVYSSTFLFPKVEENGLMCVLMSIYKTSQNKNTISIAYTLNNFAHK